MRFVFLVALVATCLASGAARADEELSADLGDEPYEGFVIVDQADVLAGPSRRYYTTARLAYGDSVQVFRRDAGGFLAIRPPADSFSWVAAEQVQMTGERTIGRIIATDAASWIGTNLERVREHQHHVQLKPGELVEVLGRRTVDGEDGAGEIWLKIAPPAGEFRWIRGTDVSREPPEPRESPKSRFANRATRFAPSKSREPSELDAAAESNDAESEEYVEPRRFYSPAAKPLAEADREADEPREQVAAAEVAEEVAEQVIEQAEPEPSKPRSTIRLTDLYATEQVKGAVQPARYDPPTDPAVDNSPAGDGFVPRKRKRLEPAPVPTSVKSSAAPRANRAPSMIRVPQPSSFVSRASAASSAAARPASTHPATIRARPLEQSAFAAELDALEVDLALMLAQSQQVWNLAPLKERGERLVEQGPTPADRGRARLVMDRIHEVEQAFDVPELNAPPAASLATPASAAPSPADPKYDAVGILKPVLSEGRPIAPFALVDREGNTLGYVTPGPGLNMNRYVDKEVGLYGRRGFIETMRLPHVTAQRVIDLDRHRR
jgi:hypothetical protein